MAAVVKPQSVRQSLLISKTQQYASLQTALALPAFSGGVCEGLSLMWAYRAATKTRDKFTPRHQKMMAWDGNPESAKEYQENFESFIEEVDVMFFGKNEEGLHRSKIDFQTRFKILAEKKTDEKLPLVGPTEFDIIFMFQFEELCDLFNSIIKGARDKIIIIESVRIAAGANGVLSNHEVAAFYSNNTIEYYDPNFDNGELKVKSTELLVKYILFSMQFDKSSCTFPLRIRILPLQDQKPGNFKTENAFIHGYLCKRRDRGLRLEEVHQDNCPLSATPLHLAMAVRNISLLRLLINHDLCPLTPLPKHGTCLNMAISMLEENFAVEILKKVEQNIKLTKDAAEANKIRKVAFETTYSSSKKTLLQSSVSHKGLRRVTKKLIKLGAEVNVLDSFGCTPLFIAIQEGDHEIATLLLTHGACPNLTKDNLHLPLYMAIKNGDEISIELLMKHGANLKLIITKYPFILQIAVQKCNDKILKLLISHGADVNEDYQGSTPLHQAVENGNTTVVAFLLSHRADARIQGTDQRSVLHVAKNKETAELLIKAGANVKALDRHGKSVLHYAQSAELVSYYLSLGVDANQKTRNLRSPLHDIMNVEVALSLLDAKANVEALDCSRNSPLHFVESIEVASALIARGANVNIENETGETPLHLARNVQVADILLKSKADVQAIDKQGQTPLHRAHNVEIASTLLIAGANIDVLDKEGRTPLQSAILSRRFDVAKLFIEKKANIDLADHRGNTPLFYAIEKGNVGLIEIILAGVKDINHINNNGESVIFVAIATQNPKILKLILDQHPNLSITNKMGKTPFTYVNIITSYKVLAAPLTALLNAEKRFQHHVDITLTNTELPEPVQFSDTAVPENVDALDSLPVVRGAVNGAFRARA